MLDPQLIYVAVFARPADPLGLEWINDVTRGGTDYSQLTDITGSQEYQNRFSGPQFDDLDNLASNIISSFYEALFNRAPDEAGLEYWVSNFTSATNAGLGGKPFDPGNIVIAMAEAAQGEDILTLRAKQDAADLFTNELDTAVEIAAYDGDVAAQVGRSYLAPVGADFMPTPADAYAAVELLVSSAATESF